MIVNLTLIERFAVLDLVPKKAEYLLLKQYRVLKEKLSLQSDEVHKYNIVIKEDGTFSYNKVLDVGTDIVFLDFEVDIIKKELRSLDEKKQLEDKHFSIYEKLFN